MKRFLIAAAVLASWLAIAVRGQAATAPPDAERAAGALVEQAARAYDRNQLDEALGLLARAYELSPRPSILFNQAQVLRAKDDCVAALDAYQRFIATTTPDDPNRDRAITRRVEMQTCVDKRSGERSAERAAGGEPPPAATKPEESPPAAPPTPPAEASAAGSTAAPGSTKLTLADQAQLAQSPPVVVQSPTSPTDDAGRGRRRAMRITGWALVGVGVLSATAAAVFAWQAHQAQDQLNTQLNAGSWSASLDAEGRRDATRARWFGAAAALAAGGGAALLVVSRPPAATADAPGSAASHATAALFGWSGTF